LILIYRQNGVINMEQNPQLSKVLALFSRYYCLLQITHLILLTRAAVIMVGGGSVPFPAAPPPGGWSEEVLPFMIGMGAVDALAAGLAVYAGLTLIRKNIFLNITWLVSLSLALSSAVVFLFGTLPSGAWQADPVGYGILVIFFSPLLPYLYFLLRYNQNSRTQR
jgi:hypothetical protein